MTTIGIAFHHHVERVVDRLDHVQPRAALRRASDHVRSPAILQLSSDHSGHLIRRSRIACSLCS
jgi:hypothetical protein